MEFSKDALPGLFKSLRPQPERQDAAVRIAQKKWPIFQSVQAVLTQPPPRLTDDERAHWIGKGLGSDATDPIEPVSRAQTLANSLQSLNLPAVDAVPDEAPAAQRSRPQWRAAEKPVGAETTGQRPDSALAAKETGLPPTRLHGEATPTPASDSLAQVFERLRGDKKVETPAVQRKPSAFLSRLGKR